ncbi:MAG: AAA family ATPase [Patescibacteria group bacterium]
MLKSLTLEGWRNFSDQFALKPGRRLVIVGANGSGKSNLIEAIRLLSVGKSFKTHTLEESINFNQPYWRIKADLTKDRAELFYGRPFVGEPISKKLSVNNTEVSLLDWYGRFPTVLFLPTDLAIVDGPPRQRRRLFDSILWQTDRDFRQVASRLAQTLFQRQLVLKKIKSRLLTVADLKPWTDLLEELTATVQEKRRCLSEELGLEGVELVYQPNLQPNSEAEIRLGVNLMGAQRDDWGIIYLNRPAGKFASRGQTRLIITRLLVSQVNYLQAKLKTTPTILLDDLASELDEESFRLVLDLAESWEQVVATAVKPTTFPRDWPVVNL